MYNLYRICVQLCHGRVSIFHVYAVLLAFFLYGRASFFLYGSVHNYDKRF